MSLPKFNIRCASLGSVGCKQMHSDKGSPLPSPPFLSSLLLSSFLVSSLLHCSPLSQPPLTSSHLLLNVLCTTLLLIYERNTFKVSLVERKMNCSLKESLLLVARVHQRKPARATSVLILTMKKHKHNKTKEQTVILSILWFVFLDSCYRRSYNFECRD